MPKKFYLVLIIAFVSGQKLHAQWAMSEMNLAHQYDAEAEVFLKGKTSLSGDSLHLTLEIDINQSKPQLYDYSFDIFLSSDLNQKLKAPIDKTQIDSTLISSFKNKHVLKFSTPHKNAGWAIVRVSSGFSGYNLYFEFRITAINSPNYNIQKEGVPVINNAIQPGNYQSNEALTGYYYTHDFGIALPPMSAGEIPQRTMNIDSVFKWPKYEFQYLEKPGLYYVQADTSSQVGRAYLVTEKFFPKPATLDQLIEPLVYITTRKEKEQLDNVLTKKDFDQFWLDLTDSPERARNIIKEYYSRVEFANVHFTNYKEGWKTDPGMIFIIFGAPDEVLKHNKKETWIYLQNSRLPKIKFEFIKSNNVFSSSQYTLLRDKNYDNVWFRAVDLWRKSRF
ncbi:MAG: GWxTD domain-containing protein [Fulvivirga sp.]